MKRTLSLKGISTLIMLILMFSTIPTLTGCKKISTDDLNQVEPTVETLTAMERGLSRLKNGFVSTVSRNANATFPPVVFSAATSYDAAKHIFIVPGTEFVTLTDKNVTIQYKIFVPVVTVPGGQVNNINLLVRVNFSFIDQGDNVDSNDYFHHSYTLVGSKEEQLGAVGKDGVATLD